MSNRVQQLWVTDHALIRYLERVRGFDFENERAAIRKVCSRIGDLGTGTVLHDGHQFEIVGRQIVTVTPRKGHPNATKRRLLGVVT